VHNVELPTGGYKSDYPAPSYFKNRHFVKTNMKSWPNGFLKILIMGIRAWTVLEKSFFQDHKSVPILHIQPRRMDNVADAAAACCGDVQWSSGDL